MKEQKQTISLGAYGWRHEHWLNVFYPDDLPEDWQLTYYSNEFNAVLVPATYWRTGQIEQCEDWMGSVSADFQFFIECDACMFDDISLVEFTAALKILSPQLSALILPNAERLVSASMRAQLIELVALLEVEVFTGGGHLLSPDMRLDVNEIWRPDEFAGKSSSCFALINDELLDLRSARVTLEQYVAQLVKGNASIIIDHPRLQPANLSKFRAVKEIMGY